MRTASILGVLIGTVLAAGDGLAQTPLGTGFTYQGRLADGGTPADGPFDFQLILFDAPVGGSQVGPILTADDVAVMQGLFTVSPDFGAVFDGDRRWLEIGVRPGPSTGSYTVLSPRQELTASPGSLFSSTTPWAGVGGKPAGFDDDVDDDALGGLSCGADEVAKWNGAAWACAADADTTYSQGPGISIAGTVISVAASGITTAMILDGTVTAADLASDSVGSAEIATDSITAADIAGGAVGTSEIANSAVTSFDIATDAITAADIAASAVGTSEIASNAVERAEINGTERELYQVAPACGGGNADLTLATTCMSALCLPLPPQYLNCAGVCNQSTSQVCNNTLLGYLLGPTIP